MKKRNLLVLGLIAVAIILISLYYFNLGITNKEVIKIGIITPLTGDVAYWGQSSLEGIRLAEEDLKNQGINAKFIIEDGQLNPQVALTAVQKLVNVDNVQAVYSEFAPVAISVSSFLKDKSIIHIYNAAIESPLSESENNYKSYTDFKENCKSVASYLKGNGVKKVGMLKVNAEFAELCKQGVEEVYPDLVEESFNFGERDFRTIILKLKTKNVEAVFNPSLIAEAQLGLTEMKKQELDIPYVVAYDALLPSFIRENPNLMEKVITFGFPDVSEDFRSRLSESIPAPEAAAVTYTHLMQLGKAINKCGDDLVCLRASLDSSVSTDEISFKGFINRIAVFDMPIKKWNGEEFVSIK